MSLKYSDSLYSVTKGPNKNADRNTTTIRHGKIRSIRILKYVTPFCTRFMLFAIKYPPAQKKTDTAAPPRDITPSVSFMNHSFSELPAANAKE